MIPRSPSSPPSERAWRPFPRRPVAGLLLAGLLLGPAAACSRAPRPSVVLITIDTLRADHLGCYGYARATTPHIDALAKESLLFERAFTTLPRTTQSIASIMTGRYPKSHGARGLFSRLPATNQTLAEILKERGYATAAVVSNTFLRPGQGFEQGFDTYDNPENRWDADSAMAITAGAIKWLDAGGDGRPFFLWVHYLDPHWRYTPPAPWDRAFDPGFGEPFTLYDDLDHQRVTKGQVIFGDVLTPRQVAHVTALYDGEIAASDAAVGLLLERLSRVTTPLIVVLTSDHGESLGDHGYRFAHGEYLYESGLRVPLLIRVPGAVSPGTRASGLAENIDVAPTILGLLGVDAMQGVEGRPLLVPQAGGGPPGRFAPAPGRPFTYAESDYQLIHPENPRAYVRGPAGRWTSASDGRYKLILIPRSGDELIEMYDLERDPGELHDLAGDPAFAEARSRLLREVKQYSDYGTGPAETGAPPPEPESISPEERDRLRSLGYVN
ncbi:MAG TPA: sulfatase [Patescibacteria group bacterium]|nr:sulfatase [Patescibacteria group bacterium]